MVLGNSYDQATLDERPILRGWDEGNLDLIQPQGTNHDCPSFALDVEGEKWTWMENQDLSHNLDDVQSNVVHGLERNSYDQYDVPILRGWGEGNMDLTRSQGIIEIEDSTHTLPPVLS